jgi:hypothetical protein
VQQALDDIRTMIIGLGSVVVGNSAPVASGTVPVYDGTSGRALRSTPTAIDSSWGDLFFPVGSGGSIISKQFTNLTTKAESLQIWSQGNSGGGSGGDLILGAGYNFSSGQYDGMISLWTSRLAFNSASLHPLITQNDSSGSPNDLFIISQGTTSSATPSSLWLESGVNSLGQHGSVYLYSYPGVVSVQASALSFDSTYPAVLTQEDWDTPIATSMYITAQSIPWGAVNNTGTPGDLWLKSGHNPNNNHSGQLHLNANNGYISIDSRHVYFDPALNGVIISQYETDYTATDFEIIAQCGTYQKGGDLNIYSGIGFLAGPHNSPGDDGYININSGLGQVNIEGTCYGGRGGVNLGDVTFFSNCLGPGSSGGTPYPINGVFVFANGDNLYCRTPSGAQFLLTHPSLAS